MAILSDPERVACWLEFMRDAANINAGASGLTKAQIRAAIDATDQWIEDNAAAFNLALPAAVRAALTAKQKAILYSIVSLRRYGVL